MQLRHNHSSMDNEDFQKLLVGGKVEVVEDGKQVANPRIDPNVMQFLMTASMNSQLLKIRKYYDDRASNGLIQTWGMNSDNPLTITDELKEIKVDYPAQSIYLFNDGSDAVKVWVNDLSRPYATVNSGETFKSDYETHKIGYLYLQCASGETASVRIVAKD